MTPLGDDLQQARIFVTSTMSDMDLLLSDLRLDKDRAITTLIRIQTQAKHMQARGIYRAAKVVIESYQDQHKQPKIDGRLMALYKLIVQYSDGLNEIAPIMESKPQDQVPPQIKINAQQAYDSAHANLSELLPLAGEHREALESLMHLNLNPASVSVPQISFESFMPDITDAALRQARGQGKSVSISYAAENLFIEDSQVEQVRQELGHIVERLVRGKIGTPDQRYNAGLPRSGHIDISAAQGPEGLNISVLCEGETVYVTPPRSKTALSAKQLQEVGT